MKNQKLRYDPKNPDENKTQLAGHWEKYAAKNYMGASALFISEGKYANITVTIEGVYQRTVFDKATNGGKRVVVIAIKGKDEVKEMILNKTNMQRLEEFIKTPEVRSWLGKQVPLGAEYVRAGNGKMVWALRFCPKAPRG